MVVVGEVVNKLERGLIEEITLLLSYYELHNTILGLGCESTYNPRGSAIRRESPESVSLF